MKHDQKSFDFSKGSRFSFLIVFSGLFITGLISFYIYQKNLQEDKLRFDFEAKEIIRIIQNRMERYEGALIQTRAYILSSPAINSQGFKDYFDNTELLYRYPGIQGLGFAVEVSKNNLATHMKKARKELSNYKIWPIDESDFFYPIVYLQPENWRNKRAIGYNMFAEDIRKQAMELARDTGKAILSGKLTLVQEAKSPQPGFNYYLPVYEEKALINTEQQRRQALLGFIYSPFRAHDLFKALFVDYKPDIDFEIYDGEDLHPDNLLFDFNGIDDSQSRGLKKDFIVTMGERKYTLRFTAMESFRPTSSIPILFVCIIGLIITLLLLRIFLLSQQQIEIMNEAHERIKIESQKFEAIFYDSPAMMALLRGPTFIFEKINSKYAHLFEKRQIVGKALSEALPEIMDSPLPQILHDVFTKNEIYVGKEMDVPIFSIGDAQVKNMFFDFTYTRIDDGKGLPYGIFVHAVDVTEKVLSRRRIEEAEERLRLALDSALMGVWSVNMLDGTIDGDDKFKRLHGVKNLCQFQAFLKESIVPDDLENVLQALDQALKNKSIYFCEYRVKREGGSTPWIYTRGEPKFNQAGLPVSISGVSFDISDKKEIERKLMGAIKARDEFLSVASHELKTPVTSLKLQLQMADRGIKPDTPCDTGKVSKVIKVSLKQVNRLASLIDDLLDISRIESGKLSLKYEDINLESVLKELVERLSEQLSAANCQAFLNIQGPIIIYADPFRLDQVITNLITNAIKYGEGSPIYVSAECSDHLVRISVRDNGMGIDENKLHKVFERFERAVDHHKISGLGLGLFISKTIVEAHHGKIYVESKKGEGSNFVVELPRTRPQA